MPINGDARKKALNWHYNHIKKVKALTKENRISGCNVPNSVLKEQEFRLLPSKLCCFILFITFMFYSCRFFISFVIFIYILFVYIFSVVLCCTYFTFLLLFSSSSI